MTNPQNNESSVVFSKIILNHTAILFCILLIGLMLWLFDLMNTVTRKKVQGDRFPASKELLEEEILILHARK
jgi:hypothetical protein